MIKKFSEGIIILLLFIGVIGNCSSVKLQYRVTKEDQKYLQKEFFKSSDFSLEKTNKMTMEDLKKLRKWKLVKIAYIFFKSTPYSNAKNILYYFAESSTGEKIQLTKDKFFKTYVLVSKVEKEHAENIAICKRLLGITYYLRKDIKEFNSAGTSSLERSILYKYKVIKVNNLEITISKRRALKEQIKRYTELISTVFYFSVSDEGVEKFAFDDEKILESKVKIIRKEVNSGILFGENKNLKITIDLFKYTVPKSYAGLFIPVTITNKSRRKVTLSAFSDWMYIKIAKANFKLDLNPSWEFDYPIIIPARKSKKVTLGLKDPAAAIFFGAIQSSIYFAKNKKERRRTFKKVRGHYFNNKEELFLKLIPKKKKYVKIEYIKQK
jgi:hypothetical protein